MALANNNSRLTGYKFVLLLNCLCVVFICAEVANETFKEAVNELIPEEQDSFDLQNSEHILNESPSFNNEQEQQKNVLDTLKVVLQKVKKEVKEEVQKTDDINSHKISSPNLEKSTSPSPTLENTLQVTSLDVNHDETRDFDAGKKFKQKEVHQTLDSSQEKEVFMKAIEQNLLNPITEITTNGESEGNVPEDIVKKQKRNGNKVNVLPPTNSNQETLLSNERHKIFGTSPHELHDAASESVPQQVAHNIPSEVVLDQKEVSREEIDVNSSFESKAKATPFEVDEKSAIGGEGKDAAAPSLPVHVPVESSLEGQEMDEFSEPGNATEESASTPAPPEASQGDDGAKANESLVLTPQSPLDDALKEKDQLETYSQFAERVTAEKKNGGSTNGHATNGQPIKGPKVKSKNYASTDCGAKFLAANPESSHSHKIINSNKDEYMLNKCTGKVWAIVELCESIQPQKFDIANFELFSNSPKDIFLFGSHRYPTREWIPLGAYEGEEGNREVQSFHVDTPEFFKFIKLEVHTYYGTEFFCPLSMFKIYGLSEFEVIEETDDTEEEPIIEEEAMEEKKEKEKSGMIPDVIKSMLSGVIEVIKRGSRSGNITSVPELNAYTQSCRSLHAAFSIKKEECSFAESLNYILACYYDEYLQLMVNPFIAAVVQNYDFCHQLASLICTSPNNNDSFVYDSVCNNSYACVMLSPKHILAMCHMHDPSILHDLAGCPANDTRPHENATSTNAIEDVALNIAPLVQENRTQPSPVPDVQTANGGFDDPAPMNPAPLPDPPKPALEEKVVIQLPHIDSPPKRKPPKDTSKKQQDESEEIPHKKANATEPVTDPLGTPKEAKAAEKESGEKVATASEDAPSLASGSAQAESRSSPSHSNKESVVVRLSNKIKVLEHNMSISSQYLEELSRRYKRQMEEMQSQFNITILALNSTSQNAYERDLYHQKRLEALEGQVETLVQVVSNLASEKEALLTSVVEQHMILLFVEVVVLCLVFGLCLRRQRNEVAPFEGYALDRREGSYRQRASEALHIEEEDPQGRDTPSLCRRRSVDSIQSEGKAKPRERRLSGQMAVAGPYTDLLISESSNKERKKRRKKPPLKRSLSNASTHEAHRSSSAPTKKEKKMEKLKRSSAGVLFSAEGKGQGQGHESRVDAFGKKGKEGLTNGSWRVVRKRSKAKSEAPLASSEEQHPYVLPSDLRRGKITLDELPTCNIYQHQFYSEIPFDQSYSSDYGKEFFDVDYKDAIHLDNNTFPPDVEPSRECESFNVSYASEMDYNAPVINDYYHCARGVSEPKEEDSSVPYQVLPDEDSLDSTLWIAEKLPKSLTKASALSEFRSPAAPSSFKGKTKLRSDNWEWYSSQPSRLASSCPSTSEVVSNSSSDSSVRSKAALPTGEGKGSVLNNEKKKKKKNKALKMANGESR